MSNKFEATNMTFFSLPIYRNEANGSLLGFIAFKKQKIIFASGVNQVQEATYGIFSHFIYANDEIYLEDCLTTTGRYDDQTDTFKFQSGSKNYTLCNIDAGAQGKYRRIATCLCELKNGEFRVNQILSN
ncbi:hypothetical protein SYK_11870 [Pseudodesulfovibrio nedwellii]|uniref:Uncharacterized protein n=1 Tax=Pseudodesulfovibrio nedwellii TaxID=2973072 RepID=A0ABM8AZ75_9BACT|nr:hypothetical protein [Pseudodesulfovibrio nedwellii]BDQ36827.1 hypothetical protein SYK_11870 [Pseudodesulfovibrio nedwellii]